MHSLIQTFIPNAPKLGLHVVPNIPEKKLSNAIRDYAPTVPGEKVVAIYDGTLMGSGKDGALFLGDRLIYQNVDLEPTQEIRYDDIVRVNTKKRFLGGRQIILDVNSAQATVTHTLDCSGHPEAAEYIARFLHEAMLHIASHGGESEGQEVHHTEHKSASGTDVDTVYASLEALLKAGKLTREDFTRLVDTLMES